MGVQTGLKNLLAQSFDLVTSGVISPENIPDLASQYSNYTNGVLANQIDTIYARVFSLLTSTAQTVDFFSFTGPGGETSTLARIRELFWWIPDTTLAHTVQITPAASNPLASLFTASSGGVIAYPGGGVANPLSDPTSVGSGVGAVVTSTSRGITLTPGAYAVSVYLLAWGCSTP